MLRLNQVSLKLGTRLLLDSASYHFEHGGFYALAGENGCGKSSLLRAICSELTLVSGSIESQCPTDKRAYLAQQSTLDRQFPISVEQAVSAGLWHQSGAFKAISNAARQQVQKALQEVGLAHCAKAALNQLSGGQFQRLRFARMLVQQAQLLLLDEPFNAVDQRTTTELLQVLLRCQQQGKTILLISHDPCILALSQLQTLIMQRQTITPYQQCAQALL